MRLTIQVFISLLIVAAVLWFMWRLPRRGESLFGWAPPLALISAWMGLIATICSALLWVLPYPDTWVTLLFLFFDPLAIGAGILVLWIYRGFEDQQETVSMQLAQAKVGLALGLIAVIVGYMYVMSHKPPFTTVGT